MKSKLLAALVISASALFASAGVQAQDAPPDADASVQQNAPQENGTGEYGPQRFRNLALRHNSNRMGRSSKEPTAQQAWRASA